MENSTEIKLCQSCARPLDVEEAFGTNADGSKNEEYCIGCYKKGAFTLDLSLEEMIEHTLPYISSGNPFPDQATARKSMQEVIPKLKRWQTS